MGQEFDAATADVWEWLRQNNAGFQGIEPSNIIAHLGKVNPNLWNRLNAAYQLNQEGKDTLRPSNAALVAGPGGIATEAILRKMGVNFGGNQPTLNEWAFSNPGFANTLLTQGSPSEMERGAPPPATPPPATKPETVAVDPNEEKRKQMMAQLEEIFGRAEESGGNAIRRQFAPLRQNQISEEAALGRLSSPVSITNLSRVDEQQGNALSDLVGKLAVQKASGLTDFSKTLETILAGEAEGERKSSDLEKTLALDRERLTADVNSSAADRALKKQLGMADIEAKTQKPQRDWLDILQGTTGSAKNLKDIFA